MSEFYELPKRFPPDFLFTSTLKISSTYRFAFKHLSLFTRPSRAGLLSASGLKYHELEKEVRRYTRSMATAKL
jgi:hypothetical protein